MRQLIGTMVIVLPLLFGSCARQDTAPATGPQATVFLRDGTKFAGTVVKSSPAEVTLAGEGANSRTFDMKDVKSIEYGEPATQPQAQAPVEPRSAEGQRVPAREPARATAPIERPHPAESAIRTKINELPVGTEVAVRTDETIDSGKAAEGQVYAAEVYKDVIDAAGDVVFPRGSNAKVVIRSSSKAGHITGASDLMLDLQSVTVDGRQYQLDTADLQQHGKQGVGKNKRTAEYVGGGALVGTIIGAIAGHGKGAAIGAASGAAAGAATQVLTRGSSIRVPAETVLTFRLDKPLRVVPSRQ